ncbi:LADA_0B11694g1_1 [Lachancea dasiensis]|uniref:LADA_0B11694g1_1 n=1 Tax=Lachancea dasiensis TaxID=1072105 RepID=A0A1G4IVW9_9SACH|nr:LADA_0B11694g1_1 [Lachancea dasiensis]
MSTSITVPDSIAVEYYSPEPPAPAGSAVEPQPDGKPIPRIFQKLKLKNLELPNRIGVSPMCMYSADANFEATPFHQIHYGQLFLRGPGLTIVEATAVSPEGPLSPQDLGIWTDKQAEKLKGIVDFAHAQKQLVAVQIGHGGRKASGLAMYLHLEQIADKSIGGWPENVVAPSAIQYRPNGNYLTPRELTNEEVKRIVKDFGLAAKRAVEISGFDAIELHGAHGYLISEFLSATSNKRTDEYGGSFNNRIRFLLEIIEEVKAQVGESVPLLLRISASENVDEDEDSWKLEDSVKLAKIVVEKGVDMLDISSGGNNYKQSSRGKKAVHAQLSKEIKKAVGDSAIVASVGGLALDIDETTEMIERGDYDIALIGREFLRNPGLVWSWADKLGIRINHALQYGWGFYPNKEQIVELIEKTKNL